MNKLWLLIVIVFCSCVQQSQGANTAYIVATAYDSFGIESDYSSELATQYTNNQLYIKWDANLTTNIIGYNIYWGTNSGDYQWITNSGTNSALIFKILSVKPVTNYFRLFDQYSTNGLSGFKDASAIPFRVIINTLDTNLWLWRLRISITNAL